MNSFVLGVDQKHTVDPGDINGHPVPDEDVLVTWSGTLDNTVITVYAEGYELEFTHFVGVRRVQPGKLLGITPNGAYMDVHYVPYLPE